jgi:hypothetical protein
MVGLGDLGGGIFSSIAKAASYNGSVVVGRGNSGSGDEAFIWDQTNGMRSLTALLVNDFGLDLTDWTLTEAIGISDDGLTIVGWGNDPNGNSQAWMAVLDPPPPVPAVSRRDMGILAILLGLAGLAVMGRRSAVL